MGDVTAQRWGENARVENRAVGQLKLLRAAREILKHDKIDKFRMAELSAAAGVSRRTLYNYFPTKGDVLLGVVELESHELLDRLSKEIPMRGSFTEYVLDTMVFMIRHQTKQPCFQALSGNRSVELGKLFLSSKRIGSAWRNLLEVPYRRAIAEGEIDENLSLGALLNWYGRLALSYAEYPPGKNDAELRQELNQFVVLGIKNRS